jgi:CheY-like chemotaxis protein
VLPPFDSGTELSKLFGGLMSKAPYNILLVEDSDDHASRIKSVVARTPDFRIVYQVKDAVAALEYLKGWGEFVDRRRFPLPEIVMLDLNAPNADHLELMGWAQRRTLRPALVAFSTPDRGINRALSEKLSVDLYEPNIWSDHTFDRFLLFAGNIAAVKRRH